MIRATYTTTAHAFERSYFFFQTTSFPRIGNNFLLSQLVFVYNMVHVCKIHIKT